MATLHTSHSSSALIARNRLEADHFRRKPVSTEGLSLSEEAPINSDTGIPVVVRTDTKGAVLNHIDLIMRVADHLQGWEVFSVKQAPRSEHIAILIPAHAASNPVEAVKAGQIIKIIVEATGDLRIIRPSSFAKPQNWLARLRRS